LSVEPIISELRQLVECVVNYNVPEQDFVVSGNESWARVDVHLKSDDLHKCCDCDFLLRAIKDKGGRLDTIIFQGKDYYLRIACNQPGEPNNSQPI
jgi:hypothetical protein